MAPAPRKPPAAAIPKKVATSPKKHPPRSNIPVQNPSPAASLSSFASSRSGSCSVASLSFPATLTNSAVVLEPSILKDDLAAFGIKAASGPKGKYLDKDSKLKCCLIEGHDGSAIVFRVEPNDPNIKSGSWGEKCFFDALHENEEWLTTINIDSTALAWFHENVPQKNPKNFSIHLFVIYTEANLPPKENIVKLGQYICQHLNATPGNHTTTILHDDSFFWLPDGAVWSDIIGCDAALARLIKNNGHPSPGYYDLHRQTIHTYFHPQTLSINLARNLYAPIEEVHPSLREGLAEPGDNDDDDDDSANDNEF
jgi:hypothetical protein